MSDVSEPILGKLRGTQRVAADEAEEEAIRSFGSQRQLHPAAIKQVWDGFIGRFFGGPMVPTPPRDESSAAETAPAPASSTSIEAATNIAEDVTASTVRIDAPPAPPLAQSRPNEPKEVPIREAQQLSPWKRSNGPVSLKFEPSASGVRVRLDEPATAAASSSIAPPAPQWQCLKPSVAQQPAQAADEDAVARAKRIWKQLDVDNSGYIEREELRNHLKSTVNLSDEMVERVFGALDSDGNEKIELEEWLRVYARRDEWFAP